MPVIYLLNVAKHNLVLPFHVIWYSVFSHPGHVTLKIHITASPQTFTLILDIQQVWGRFTHLNNQTEIPHIVPLSLRQLQQDIAEERKKVLY